MKRSINEVAFSVTTAIVLTLAAPLVAFCDIPPPRPEPPPALIEWGYVVSGILFAMAGALIFVWLGRRFVKR